jgi:nucleoside-diphosphate-sugar epimerase
MRVCVVGGTGNISTSIVRRLLELGHDVTIFNRGKTADPVPPEVRQIRGDRADTTAFEAAMQREKFDAAIDMICFRKEDALSSIRAFRDVGHFIQCSTVCTYGIEYDFLPADETHRLRPISDYGRNKVAADNAFLEAYHAHGFPITIIKPSTTYGPKMGLLRQVAWEFSWISRIRAGKPIIVCGDGNALHQFLHVDDAALCFAGVLGNPRTIGQIYNMTRREPVTWTQWHRAAMRVIGREVELIGVPFETLKRFKIPAFDICDQIFAHHVYYSSEKLFRDVPDFQPRVTLEAGIASVLEAMERDNRIPTVESNTWEDAIIEKQKEVGI